MSVTVANINDAPGFTKGPNVTLREDAGPQSVFNWATDINAAPSETAQALEFLVTSDSAALFAVAPAIDAAGTLTYPAAPNTTGMATVAIWLRDNGGVADGGVDTSARRRCHRLSAPRRCSTSTSRSARCSTTPAGRRCSRFRLAGAEVRVCPRKDTCTNGKVGANSSNVLDVLQNDTHSHAKRPRPSRPSQRPPW